MVNQEAQESIALRTPLMGVNAVARRLGVSRDTVYRLVRRGDLAPFRVGHRMRFSSEEISAFLEEHRERASVVAHEQPSALDEGRAPCAHEHGDVEDKEATNGTCKKA